MANFISCLDKLIIEHVTNGLSWYQLIIDGQYCYLRLLGNLACGQCYLPRPVLLTKSVNSICSTISYVICLNCHGVTYIVSCSDLAILFVLFVQGDHSNLTNRIPSSRYNKIRQKIKDKYVSSSTRLLSPSTSFASTDMMTNNKQLDKWNED